MLHACQCSSALSNILQLLFSLEVVRQLDWVIFLGPLQLNCSNFKVLRVLPVGFGDVGWGHEFHKIRML